MKPNHSLLFHFAIFEKMSNVARNALRNISAESNTQVIVLHSASGQIHYRVVADALAEAHTEERELIENAREDAQGRVEHILCMWHDGSIDLPSYAFRKALLSLNGENAWTQIFLLGENKTPRLRELKVTLNI